tara:strand:+ start:2956 stop:3330 length:375 start_codon:yes stop_codon:yes gene_type:complete
MKRYDNGEVVTASRMEEEPWYYTLYQPFLHVAIWGKSTTVEEMYEEVLNNDLIGNMFNTDSKKERLLRWCVFIMSNKSHYNGTDVHPNPKYTIPQIKKYLREYCEIDDAYNALNIKNMTDAIAG